MSRLSDIEHLEVTITNLKADQLKVVETFNEYDAEIQESINALLTDAEIFDEFQELQNNKAEARANALARIEEIKKEVSEASFVLNFLLERQQEDPEIMPVPEVVEPTISSNEAKQANGNSVEDNSEAAIPEPPKF